MFDKFSYKTFLHFWSPGCLLSLSLLPSKICLFYSWDSNFLAKALLDLLFKKITSITSEHAFLTFQRGLVDSSVLKGRQRGSPWATPKLQTHCAWKHPGSILVAVGDGWCGPHHMSFTEVCWQNWVIPSRSLQGASHPNCLPTLWVLGAPEVSPTHTSWDTLTVPSRN